MQLPSNYAFVSVEVQRLRLISSHTTSNEHHPDDGLSKEGPFNFPVGRGMQVSII